MARFPYITGAHGTAVSRMSAVLLASGACLALLMVLGLWLLARLMPADGLAWAIVFAPDRQLNLTVWTHDLAFSDAYTTAGLTRQKPGPLRLTVSYQHRTKGPRKQLLVLPIPSWPLCVSAGLLLLAAGNAWWSAASKKMPKSPGAP